MSKLPAVRHNSEASRFELVVDGELARCDYRLHDDVLSIHHTEVPPALTGRGIAAALVRAALEHATRQGLRVRPLCSYVRAYLARHPHDRNLIG